MKILIAGESGSGKSSSIKYLNPEETFIIGVTKRNLPFKGWRRGYKPFDKTGKGNHINGMSSYSAIMKMMDFISMNLPNIKTLIIDDFQYVMSFEFMRRATERGFDKFTEMAKQVTDIIMKADTLRDDLNVVFLTHSENKGSETFPMHKIKTIGKLLDEKITLEGLFDVVLFTDVIEVDAEAGEYEYKFLTNTNGTCIAKSPLGMFSELHIDNNLQLVLESIHKFEYGED